MVTIGLVPPPNVGIPIYSIPEDGGSVPVCVELVIGNLAPGTSVSVTFNTVSGVATGELSRKQNIVGTNFIHIVHFSAPLDFMDVSMLVVFNAGNTNDMICVEIPIVDDSLCEGNEQFQVSLENNDPANVNLAPGRATGTVTIIDDDGKVV